MNTWTNFLLVLGSALVGVALARSLGGARAGQLGAQLRHSALRVLIPIFNFVVMIGIPTGGLALISAGMNALMFAIVLIAAYEIAIRLGGISRQERWAVMALASVPNTGAAMSLGYLKWGPAVLAAGAGQMLAGFFFATFWPQAAISRVEGASVVETIKVAGRKMFTHPVFWATAAGLVLNFAGAQETQFYQQLPIDLITTILAVVVTMAMVLDIGIGLVAHPVKNWQPIALIWALGCLLAPACVYLIGYGVEYITGWWDYHFWAMCALAAGHPPALLAIGFVSENKTLRETGIVGPSFFAQGLTVHALFWIFG